MTKNYTSKYKKVHLKVMLDPAKLLFLASRALSPFVYRPVKKLDSAPISHFMLIQTIRLYLTWNLHTINRDKQMLPKQAFSYRAVTHIVPDFSDSILHEHVREIHTVSLGVARCQTNSKLGHAHTARFSYEGGSHRQHSWKGDITVKASQRLW